MVAKELDVQVRIYATNPDVKDVGTYSTELRFAGKSDFQTDALWLSSGYPAANLKENEFTYLWIAGPFPTSGDDNKFFRLKVKPWSKE